MVKRAPLLVLGSVILLSAIFIDISTDSSGKFFKDVLSFMEKQLVLSLKKEEVKSLISGEYYRVVRVVDGDTIDIRVGAKKIRVRLIGVDTPEVVDPRKPVECFGKEASHVARDLVLSKMVRIVTDHTQGDYDAFQRLLAYVYMDNGVMLNKYMIEEGYAHEYTYRIPYRHQEEFMRAEKEARENAQGLWAKGVCEEKKTPS